MGAAAGPDTAERAVGPLGPGPRLVTDRTALAEARAALPGTVAVVMTMGALHEGHRSLIRLAADHADHVVVTVFVNPLQFGPGEDLDAYPRTLAHDLAVCAEAGVDVVFAPAAREVYPGGEPQVLVRAGEAGLAWEGRSRPGHFDGVLTVVLVLLHLVRPDVAVFGRKDRQQLALVRRMVDDLAVGVRLVAGETVREPDGLARSSRNAYLDDADRTRASALPRAGSAAVAAASAGAPATEVLTTARHALQQPGVAVDYCALVRPDDLTEVAPDHVGAAVLLLAARVGRTRLIDNVDLTVGPATGPGTTGPGTTGPATGGAA